MLRDEDKIQKRFNMAHLHFNTRLYLYSTK